MIPIGKLDEFQLAILRKCANFPEKTRWIEGFAGSGKTILLIHTLQRYLQENVDSKVCVVVFTHALIDLIQSGIKPEYQDRIPVKTYLQFVNNDKHYYDFVVVDEVQDIPRNILNKIRKKTKRLLFAGDEAQSIYESGCSSSDIETLFQPARLKLPRVYRLTRKIINVVKSILPDNNLVAATSARMTEVQVTLARANSKDEELYWVWQQAKYRTEIQHPSVVVFPNHEEIQNFMSFVAHNEELPQPEYPLNNWKKTDYVKANTLFRSSNSSTYLQYIGNGYGNLEESDTAPIVYVMTYHSIKGLDFRTVFLPLLIPQTSFWQEPDIDRRLFFVGATRSWRDLFMSYHGQQPHSYIQNMPQHELHKIDIAHSNAEGKADDFIF